MQGGVRKRGDTWYYYFDAGRVDGKRKKIERKGGKTKKEALSNLRKALDEFENGGSFVDQSEISVADYFDYWYENYVMINLKYNSQIGYKNIIDKHIKPEFGYYKLKSIQPDILQNFLNKKLLAEFKKNTISGFYGVLSKGFRMAVHPYKYIKENPMQYVTLPKKPNNKNKITRKQDDFKIISLDEFNRIIKRFPEKTAYYIPLQIGFHTGMRIAEVCGLTWDCVDLEEGKIHVEKILIMRGNVPEFGTPKTKGSIRTIQIGKTLISILKAHKERQETSKERYGEYYTQSNYVCTMESGSLVTQNTIKYLSRVVNDKLGIKFSFHSLRHTHATMLIESGANTKGVQVRLGHSRHSTTVDTYSHVTPKMADDTVDIFENKIK
ncbi:tyrosine-type recombinase/integrase [Paenilisteria newyorkensis]|uniref:tyrosine-type recombinase/integrase n=1 Tax=Listeria newyorkensis TaxID=1497681 RepID=UPI0023591E3D|nr:tyrosine-type recombinase/integrase [Listeria newyorkensis]WAO20804.1 tyrosine-type recombinase/integrase [Listeria newyorkensis]